MGSVEAFALFDCNLVRCALGRTVTNLRELLEAVKTAPDAAIEHHMMRCALDNHFELYEFPNDLARWCREALGNAALERSSAWWIPISTTRLLHFERHSPTRLKSGCGAWNAFLRVRQDWSCISSCRA